MMGMEGMPWMRGNQLQGVFARQLCCRMPFPTRNITGHRWSFLIVGIKFLKVSGNKLNLPAGGPEQMSLIRAQIRIQGIGRIAGFTFIEPSKSQWRFFLLASALLQLAAIAVQYSSLFVSSQSPVLSMGR